MNEKMVIVATAILHQAGGDTNFEESPFLMEHYEEQLIDYDYLKFCKVNAELLLHDMFTSIPECKEPFYVELMVNYWYIDSAIYTVENHQKKQIKKTICELNFDENDIINPHVFAGYFEEWDDIGNSLL